MHCHGVCRAHVGKVFIEQPKLKPGVGAVTGCDVYLVDFSYPRAVIADMVKKANSVTLIDHHKTALEDLFELDGLIQFTDINRSGAMLAWNYLFPDEEPPLLIKYVQDRDLWPVSYTHLTLPTIYSV